MLLSIKELTVHYGKAEAVKAASLEVEEGKIVTLIGANGAGKSTTLRAISGLVNLTSGEIWFSERRVNGFPPSQLVKMGIGHVPEGRRIFPKMTVTENLLMGSYLRSDKEGIKKDFRDEVYSRFPILQERRGQLAGSLSGGEQQMLAIGRALMSRPKLLLMDEPSLGLSPIMVQEIAKTILSVFERGTSILLVEQNVFLALKLAHKGYVMETGRIMMEGDSRDLLNNDNLKRAYLGI